MKITNYELRIKTGGQASGGTGILPVKELRITGLQINNIGVQNDASTY